MAKQPHLSSYQKGIVRRYYDHADSRVAQKLQEVVSELYLASAGPSPSAAAIDKLWASAEKALAQSAAADQRVAAVLKARSVEGLARLVADLTAPGAATAKPKPRSPAPPPDSL